MANLLDLQKTLKSLFNQGGKTVQHDFIQPAQKAIYNWGVQNPQQSQQILQAPRQIQQGIGNVVKSVANQPIINNPTPFKLPFQSPTVGQTLPPLWQTPLRVGAQISKSLPNSQFNNPFVMAGMNTPFGKKITDITLGKGPIDTYQTKYKQGYDIPIVGKVKGIASIPLFAAGAIAGLSPLSGGKKAVITDAVNLAKRAGTVEEFTKLLSGAKPEVKKALQTIFKDTKNPINTVDDFFNKARGTQATGGVKVVTQQPIADATLKPQTVPPQSTDLNTPGLGGQRTVATGLPPKVVEGKSLLNGSSGNSIPPPEEVAKSIPAKIDQFMQDTAGYSTQTPTGGSRGATPYTKILRAGQARVTTAVEGALGSENKLIRTAASTLQNVFRGLGMSPERATASFDVKGGMGTANQRAFDVMSTLYDAIGKSPKSLERVNAVLDPAISKTKVSFEQLTTAEKAVYTLIRQGLDLTHDISYANGHISPEIYRANMGKYTPRLYDVYEMPAEISKFVNQGKKIATDLYKSKKDLTAWKIDNSLNDPVYALGKRLSQVQTNTAIGKYTDFLSTQSHLVSDVEKPGFIQLSDSPAYGNLAGKYVLNSAAEDLKGAFFSNQGVQNLYDAFRAYDRLGIRQLQKKILTVFNPTTNVGNIVSDQVFGFVTGINPYTLNKNIVLMKRNPAEYKQISEYLMRKGIIGTDITRTDFVDKLSSIDSLAEDVGKTQSGAVYKIKDTIQRVDNKAQAFYGGTDDIYKAAAFKGLLDRGFTLEEATRKVADGFQNYASVGKFYDMWAKTPIVGSAFIKFQGDLIRIIKNGAVNNPVALIGFLGALYGVARLSSKASGETEQDRITRENRFAAPMIPGLNIPLTWQTPIGEINVARYISPFYANNETTSPLKMLPFVPNIKLDKSGNLDAATSIAQSANDPLLSTPIQLLVNRDFRGKPITDPNENKYQPSTLTGGEKLTNQLKFAGGNYLPPTVNSLIDVKRAAEGKSNRYGSMQTVPQAVARVGGIKISQYGAKEAQKQRENDLYYNNLSNEGNNKLINAVNKDRLTGKIDQQTAYKRIAELKKNAPQDTGGLRSSVGGKIQYVGSNGELNTIDLTPPTTGSGIDAFTNQSWKYTKARELWKARDKISQDQLNQGLKKLGVDTQETEYDYKAKHTTDEKTQYIVAKADTMPHDTLINELIKGRVVSVSGTQFAANGVIDNLYNQGLISSTERKALRRIKTDNKGKSLTNISVGRGARGKKGRKGASVTIKKVSSPKIKFSKLTKRTPPSVKLSKAVVVKPAKAKKSIKLAVPQASISYTVSRSKIKGLDKSIHLA